MDRVGDRRQELAALLRNRRAQVARADHGLPDAGRGGPLGLRREEVAFLAGVSITWYTWLEQGREINPSRQVIDAIAATLRLSAVEHAYVLTLAGLTPDPPDLETIPAELPSHLQRLLDAQLPAPAFALAPDWTIVGWNRAYLVLYPGVDRLPPGDRNLLVLIFTDGRVRQMLPDWSTTSRQFLAEYRAEHGAQFGQPAQAALIARLCQESTEFAAAWDQHEIGRFETRERRFRPPGLGELIFEQHRLVPADAPGLQLVIYLPNPGSDTATRLGAALRG
ncbi:helix-turn-helix transcriptional regulator [Microlunatus parietis]|uniref:Transcriptional regulator with XRE-family HTH domain n=1 Tax=Microlunatus parietis TaxID=682979 RepID=A0A7Y9LAB1_9ACTN|nr:helix-turn-helix transcriptional regulator [Microlunatus parietis]NYE70472.1 transcriptional regulator with XRE-family HTH domain [Microlunatus parietis]